MSESLAYDYRGRLTSSATDGGGAAGTGTVSIGGSEQSTYYFPPGCKAKSCAQKVYDYGTISITVDGFVASYGYGTGDTSTTVATALTGYLNSGSSPVTATLSGTVITLISRETGSGSDYTLSSTAETQNTQYFTQSSFTGTPSGSTLTGGSSGPSVYTFSLGYAPNSDVTSVNDSVNGNWTYTYDDFNRLATANITGQAYTYAYDRFGNRWQQELNGSCTAGTAVCLTFNSNNQINNGIETYDAAGNTLTDGFHNYTYDAENRITCVDSGAAVYQYDAEGQRVRKIIGASSCSATTGGTVTDYLYDLSGHEITEVNGLTGAWNRGEVYAAGRHIATYANSTTYFDHADWLGTERARTGVNGASCETMTSLPFGDNMVTAGSCGDPSTHHFTGKERDSESNLDNFGARYNSSNLGRFMSADWSGVPAPVPYANFTNPQTLNLYAIVSDNPETFADLDGHCQEGDTADSACATPFGANAGAFGEPAPNVAPDQKTGTGDSTSATEKALQSTVTIEYVKGQDHNPAGHSAISVNGKPAVGLEQKRDSVAAALEDKTTPGAVRAVDPNRTVKDRAVIAVTPEQAAKIQDFLSNSRQNPPNYNLYHSNCAQFCESAMKAGGVNYVPNDLTPRGLVEDLKGTSAIDYLRAIISSLPIP